MYTQDEKLIHTMIRQIICQQLEAVNSNSIQQ